MTCRHGTRDPSDCWECFLDGDDSDVLCQTNINAKPTCTCYDTVAIVNGIVCDVEDHSNG